MARIPLNHEPSLFLRIMTGYSKRKYGKVLDPGLAMMHNRRVLFAWKPPSASSTPFPPR
ncbi:hypothetical protein ACWF5H_12845 [Arthrobacter sp. NPDC055138]